MIAGLVLLIWLPAVRCPAAFAVAAGVVAEASLYIYLTHYQVYPLFGSHHLVGVIVSVIVGVALTAAVTALRSRPADTSPQPAGLGAGSRSAMSPSWTSVAAISPSCPIRLAVTTPRPRAAAGDRHSSRFH